MLVLTIPKKETVWSKKFSGRDFRLVKTLEEYSQMVDWVTEYCAAVRNLPEVTLENPADWYTADFIKNYAGCKAHTALWTDNGILMKLIAIPQNILAYDAMYQLYSQQIVLLANMIISDPGSKIAQEAKKQLEMYLKGLGQSVKLYQGEIQVVRESLTQFQGEVGQYKTFFEKLYKDSGDTKKADDALLTQYQSQMDTLQEDLKKWSDVQKGMYISMGVEAVVIPIALACGPFGFLTAIILGSGMIAEGITAVAADEKIKEDARQLEELTKEFDSYTRDSKTLKELITRLDALNTTLSHVEGALEGIDEAWKQLEDNIALVLSTIAEASEEEKKGIYENIVELMSESDEEWEQVVEAAKKVSLNASQPELDQVYTVEVA